MQLIFLWGSPVRFKCVLLHNQILCVSRIMGAYFYNTAWHWCNVNPSLVSDILYTLYKENSSPNYVYFELKTLKYVTKKWVDYCSVYDLIVNFRKIAACFFFVKNGQKGLNWFQTFNFGFSWSQNFQFSHFYNKIARPFSLCHL